MQSYAIHNFRIEDTRLSSRCVHELANWLREHTCLQTIGLIKVKFENRADFKILMDAIQINPKIKKVTLGYFSFEMEFHGKSLGTCLLESKSITEIDLQGIQFTHKKAFFEMS